MPTHRHLFGILLLAAAIGMQPGCVALNIPSQRHHDAADHGGLFGGWQTDRCTEGDCGLPPHHGDDCSFDGGPLEVDPLDPVLGQHGRPKQKEVPWPRYHPVPTRPVFGNAAIQ